MVLQDDSGLLRELVRFLLPRVTDKIEKVRKQVSIPPSSFRLPFNSPCRFVSIPAPPLPLTPSSLPPSLPPSLLPLHQALRGLGNLTAVWNDDVALAASSVLSALTSAA